MALERSWYVTTPNGLTWSVHFYDEAAAWARIAALKKMYACKTSIDTLRRHGWKVENRPKVPVVSAKAQRK